MNVKSEPTNGISEVDKARFWSKVEVGNSSDCWPWKAGCGRGGYGKFSIGRKDYRAHVFAFLVVKGELVNGPVVRHVVCRNPICVNPFHLEDGTHKDNYNDSVKDGMRKGVPFNGVRPKNPYKIPAMKGTDHPMNKLTEDQVREIKRLKGMKVTSLALAKSFGVSKSLVSHIWTGRLWKHLE